MRSTLQVLLSHSNMAAIIVYTFKTAAGLLKTLSIFIRTLSVF